MSMKIYSDEEKAKATDAFEEATKKCKNFYYKVNKVAPSGMSRHISFYVALENDNIKDISHIVAKVSGNKLTDSGVFVSGCGMDIAFALLNDCFSAIGKATYWQRDFNMRSL